MAYTHHRTTARFRLNQPIGHFAIGKYAGPAPFRQKARDAQRGLKLDNGHGAIDGTRLGVQDGTLNSKATRSHAMLNVQRMGPQRHRLGRF